MINTAIILAAGMGSRLNGFHGPTPKGFIEIDGKTLISMSLEKLINSGVEKILIGTGFMSECYEHLAKSYPQVSCYKNHNYNNSGSMRTLYEARSVADSDFLLLESDLLFHSSGLQVLIDSPHKDVIIASGKTNSEDEVFVECDDNGCLINMSKDTACLQKVDAELVGITRISLETFGLLCEYFGRLGHEKLGYEQALVEVSKIQKIHVEIIDDFPWCEIDYQHHWERAVKEIYPKVD